MAAGRGVHKPPGDPEAGAIPHPCPQGSRTFISFPGEELAWGEGGPEWPACSTSSESSAMMSWEEMGARPRYPQRAALWLPVVGSGNAAAPGENPAQAVVKDWLLAKGLGGQPSLPGRHGDTLYVPRRALLLSPPLTGHFPSPQAATPQDEHWDGEDSPSSLPRWDQTSLRGTGSRTAKDTYWGSRAILRASWGRAGGSPGPTPSRSGPRCGPGSPST